MDGPSKSMDHKSTNPSSGPAGHVKGHPKGILFPGARIRLCGFDARPHLNGLTGQLLAFHPKNSRWLVSLDDGSKKLILTANLQLDSSAKATTAIVAGGVSADSGHEIPAKGKAGGETPAPSMIAAVGLPMDHLKTHLESERKQALRRVAEICGKSCQEVSQC